MPTFTAAHFVALADVMRSARCDPDAPATGIISQMECDAINATCDDICGRMADTFAATNHRFDRERFLAACAVCQGFERADNIANARLIAAAPDLLAALEAIKVWGRSRDGSPEADETALREIVEIARAAIAKARTTK